MSPQLREIIDRVIVPALVERFLREQAAKESEFARPQPTAGIPAPAKEANP